MLILFRAKKNQKTLFSLYSFSFCKPMPPKQKKNNTNTNQEEEESFQAVILTDSFEEQFLPLSHELPRVKKKAVKKLVLYLY